MKIVIDYRKLLAAATDNLHL